MKTKILKQWCAALRSGEFKQGILRLKGLDGKRHCCLGVLCELHHRAEPRSGYRWMKRNTYGRREKLSLGTLPCAVFQWAGLDGVNPQIKDKRGGSLRPLSDWNDNGKMSFRKIAQMLEQAQKRDEL